MPQYVDASSEMLILYPKIRPARLVPSIDLQKNIMTAFSRNIKHRNQTSVSSKDIIEMALKPGSQETEREDEKSSENLTDATSNNLLSCPSQNGKMIKHEID